MGKAPKIHDYSGHTGVCPKCRHVRVQERRVIYKGGNVHVHRWCQDCRIVFGAPIARDKARDFDSLPVIDLNPPPTPTTQAFDWGNDE